MALYANCSHCGCSHTLEDRFAGKTIKCKECSEPFRVDAEPASEAVTPQARPPAKPRDPDRDAIQSPSRPVPPPPPRSRRDQEDDERRPPARRRVVDEDDDDRFDDDGPRRRGRGARRDEDQKSSLGLVLACAGGGRSRSSCT
jgi:hypothetical protein